MIEKEIEANIVAALAALDLPDGVAVRGAWQAASVGEVAGRESAADLATVLVSVSPRTYDIYGLCEISLSCAISVVARLEVFPDGLGLSDIVGPILDKLNLWNLDEHAEIQTFAVTGFIPGGLNFDGSAGPILDRASGAWTVDMDFTLRGTVAH